MSRAPANQIYRDKIYLHRNGNAIFSDSRIEESISHLRIRFFPAATRFYGGLTRICRLKLAVVFLHLCNETGVACVGVGIDPAATRGCRKVLELKIHGLVAPSARQVP